MALDFKRCTDLFLGTEKELALALGVPVDDVKRLRSRPRDASAERMAALAGVLEERGRAMLRVADMVRANLDDASTRGNGGGAA